MATTAPVMRARVAWTQPARRVAHLATAAGATGTVLAAVAWMSVAAAQRPSMLSSPTLRAPVPWLLGPLHGLMPGLTTDVGQLGTDVLLVTAVASAGWAVAWFAAPALRATTLLAACAVAQLIAVLGPPLRLTDVFNYELYGRMAALHGLNPYRDLPVAAAHDPAFAISNWHHLTSPYGPLFTAFSEALVPLGLHGWLWAWKLTVLVCGVGTLAIVGAIAARLGVSRQRAIVGLGLIPLLLLFEVGGLHNDLPALLCLAGAAWCIVRSRDEGAAWADPLAGGFVIAAAGIKPSFAIVAPIVVLGAGRRPRALAGAAAAAAAAGVLTLLLYGGALPNLATQGAIVTPLSLPNLVGLAIGHGGADAGVRRAAELAMVGVAGVATMAVAWRRELALPALGVVLLAAVLTLAWVMPWYLLWALPFLMLSRQRWVIPATVLATTWLIVGAIPQLPQLMHSAGYFPTRLATGMANHREFVRLLK